jgi:hypothetical protein
MSTIALPEGMEVDPMAPRHTAQDRLERTGLGESFRLPGQLELRLVERREVSEWEDIKLHCGSTLRTSPVVELKPMRVEDPGPNAPLLKRVVRYPYAMDPQDPKREEIREPREALLVGRDLHLAAAILRQAQRRIFEGSPLSGLRLGPQTRQSPVAHDPEVVGARFSRQGVNRG